MKRSDQAVYFTDFFTRLVNGWPKDLLRRYGFGVPSIQRALHSLDNDVTMVVERVLHPFQVNGSKISTRDMILHELPWPKDELATLGVRSSCW